jgi:hypothetical protein
MLPCMAAADHPLPPSVADGVPHLTIEGFPFPTIAGAVSTLRGQAGRLDTVHICGPFGCRAVNAEDAINWPVVGSEEIATPTWEAYSGSADRRS